MSAPAVPVSRSSIHVEQLSTAEELSLAPLLDLLACEHPAGSSASARRPAGSPRAVLRARMPGVRRAAGWGAARRVPGVPGDRCPIGGRPGVDPAGGRQPSAVRAPENCLMTTCPAARPAAEPHRRKAQ